VELKLILKKIVSHVDTEHHGEVSLYLSPSLRAIF